MLYKLPYKNLTVVRRFTVRKVEFESSADRIGDENLVARIVDVLLLKIDSIADKPLADVGGACAFECDVIDAAVMVGVFHDRAVRKMRAEMNDRLTIVVEPFSRSSEVGVGPLARLHPQSLFIELYKDGQVIDAAANINVEDATDFHIENLQEPSGAEPE